LEADRMAASVELDALSLHAALPISDPACYVRFGVLIGRAGCLTGDGGAPRGEPRACSAQPRSAAAQHDDGRGADHHHGWTACDRDRKSTRLNSSHVKISYAVFCLTK